MPSETTARAQAFVAEHLPQARGLGQTLGELVDQPEEFVNGAHHHGTGAIETIWHRGERGAACRQLRIRGQQTGAVPVVPLSLFCGRAGSGAGVVGRVPPGVDSAGLLSGCVT